MKRAFHKLLIPFIFLLVCMNVVALRAQSYRQMKQYYGLEGEVTGITDEVTGFYGRHEYRSKKSTVSFNKAGKVTEEIIFDINDKVLLRNVNSYKNENKILREEKWAGDLLYKVTDHKYDKNDSLVEITDSLVTGDKLYRLKTKNNKEQNSVERTWYNADGTENYREEEFYNENGKLRELKKKEKEDEHKWNYFYNKGEKMSMQLYEFNGVKKDSTVYIYDHEYNLKEEVKLHRIKKTVISKLEYEYDNDAKKVRKKTYGQNSRLESTTNYSYTTSGKLKSEIQNEEFGYGKYIYYSRKYDEHDQMSWEEYYSDGFAYEYTYINDKKGNWITRTEIKNKKPFEITTRKINYP